MCKFESSQKDESIWQSTDSSKAYRNTSAFKYMQIIIHSKTEISVDYNQESSKSPMEIIVVFHFQKIISKISKFP